MSYPQCTECSYIHVSDPVMDDHFALGPGWSSEIGVDMLKVGLSIYVPLQIRMLALIRWWTDASLEIGAGRRTKNAVIPGLSEVPVLEPRL